jgi:hypothetical protein
LIEPTISIIGSGSAEAALAARALLAGNDVADRRLDTDGDPIGTELARRSGLRVQPSQPECDVVIVGAGPADLTAAVYAASEDLEDGCSGAMSRFDAATAQETFPNTRTASCCGFSPASSPRASRTPSVACRPPPLCR